MRRLLIVLAALGVFVVGSAGGAGAHPLGNFTSNTHAELRVGATTLEVGYVLDLAEVPTLQTLQRIDTDDDGELGPSEGPPFAATRCGELAGGLDVAIAGRSLFVEVDDASVTLPEGQAGLSTLRLECTLSADLGDDVAGATLAFSDGNLVDRVGWREVVAVPDGRLLERSDVPKTSTSDALRAYPAEGLSSPLRRTDATLVLGQPAGGQVADAGGSDAAGDPVLGGIERLTGSFTELVARRDLTLGFALLAGLTSILLGAMHALAPGHGKTVMAAYLVGRSGTPRDALLLGTTVAVTHTAGVFLLGLVLSASQTLAPERLYPVLGAASGVLFTVVGMTLLRQAVAARRSGGAHGHHHDHGHEHGHGHGHGDAPGRRRSGWRVLVLPGLAGGLVPSPSALVVLLGGIALGRTWFGLALVLGYGVGMAATLVTAGYLLLRARVRIERRGAGRWARMTAVTAALPVITAALITAGGVVIVARAVAVA